uniref:HlyD family efflux transporter periplasmic adaptor subunit n=1 Tax=candidate division WOR-3 bacterium TaxID=2052148 RepID=A0A7C3Z3B7_UNCW3
MKRGTQIIFILILIGALLGFFFWRKGRNKKSELAQTNLVEVKRGTIEVKVLATGTIKPYTRVEIRSPVNGRVERVEVEEGDRVKTGEILAWISSEDRIALLDAARSALETAQRSKDTNLLKEAKKAYEIAEKAYKPVPLTNSIAGEVISRACEPGQNVTTQNVLFVVSDRLVASVRVDEADIGKIQLGQEALITLDAFPDEPVPARVTKISREAQVISDVVVYEVMVEPSQVPPRWASGMTANVSFFVQKRENVLTLPNSALKERNGEKFAFVLNNNQPEMRKIETGLTDGKITEIREGLKEGDKVLVSSGPPTRIRTQEGERRIQQMMRRIPPPGGFR